MVNSPQQTYGILYLIPTPLGDTGFDASAIAFNMEIIRGIDTFIVEELRTARRYLRKAGYTTDFENVTFHILNEHTAGAETESMLSELKKGKNAGLLSEAGLPCVADPGSVLVGIAQRAGIRVVPLVGPSSVMLALMASGFDGQRFTFHGYLPAKPHERVKAIKELEISVQRRQQTQIFIETPYRNLQLFESIVNTCQPATLLCIAADLTLDTEWIRTMTIAGWKKQQPPIQKRPAVFLLGA